MTPITLSPQTLQMMGHNWCGGRYAYIWTPDGNRYFSKKYQEWRKAKLSLWFPVNGRWPAVPAAWRDKNVYFSVHPTVRPGERWQRATINTIACVNVFFAEHDVEDYGSKFAIWSHLEKLPLFPTVIVDSGGGLHSYWWLDTPYMVTDDNRLHVRRCQAAWVDAVGGDDGAKDLPRVLRLPETRNMKPERGPDFPLVKIMELNPRRVYTFETIEGLVKEQIAHIEAKERERIAQDAARSGDTASGAAQYLLNWCVAHAHTGSRHNLALWLAGRLKAEGLARWAASSVLKDFARRVNKTGARQIEAGEMEKVVGYIWRQP
jgi:hypothetical protein